MFDHQPPTCLPNDEPFFAVGSRGSQQNYGVIILDGKHEQHGLYWDPGIAHKMQVAVNKEPQAPDQRKA